MIGGKKGRMEKVTADWKHGACSSSELQLTDRRRGGKQRAERRKTKNYGWRKRTKERRETQREERVEKCCSQQNQESLSHDCDSSF